MKNKNIEHRALSFEVSPDSRTIVGIIPYNSDSEYMGFIERLAPGCFSKTIAESRDIRALVEHDDQRLLARTKNGSLRFLDSAENLRYEFDAPNTQDGNDILELTRSGLINGSSFGMIVLNDRYEVIDGVEHRTITEAKLVEVSLILSEPAYPDTVVFTRSLSSAFEGKELSDSDKDAINAEIEKLRSLLPAQEEEQHEEEHHEEEHREEEQHEEEHHEPEGPSQEELDAIQARIDAAAARIAALEQ